MTLYERVVDVVRAVNGFTAEQVDEFAAHLRSLVPALHELRASYRSGRGTVEANYTRAVTEAYLLAYYPHYIVMAWRVLQMLPARAVSNEETLRVAVFGPGPAPEIVALARHLADERPRTTTLVVSLFDLEHEAWGWARDVSLRWMVPHYWEGSVDVTAVGSVDIASGGLVEDVVAGSVANADLVVFQNCLNELATRDDHVEENAARLITAMKPGAVLTMADIANYPTARQCLQVVERTIDSHVHWLHRADKQLLLPAQPCPQVLEEHLFREGEYPRRNAFQWRCLAAQRR